MRSMVEGAPRATMLLYVRKPYAPPVTQSINELKKKVM